MSSACRSPTTHPGGPTTLGADLAQWPAADDAGFHILAVMDHLFQIGMISPPEQDMLEAYTRVFLAAHVEARLLALISGSRCTARRTDQAVCPQ